MSSAEVLRGNDVPKVLFRFSSFQWLVFEDVRPAEDTTQERVRTFVSHPLHDQVQRHGEGKAKVIRSENATLACR